MAPKNMVMVGLCESVFFAGGVGAAAVFAVFALVFCG
jgi:hypothetical protein